MKRMDNNLVSKLTGGPSVGSAMMLLGCIRSNAVHVEHREVTPELVSEIADVLGQIDSGKHRYRIAARRRFDNTLLRLR